MRPRSRAALAVAAAATLLAVPALASAAAGPQPAAPAPTPFPSDWPNQHALGEAAARIEAVAQRRYSDAYAGVELDVPGDLVIVHRKPTPDFDEAMTRLVPHVTVRFAYAAHSQRQIYTWQEQVSAEMGYWKRRGIEIYGTGSHFGQCVVVMVGDPDRDRAAVLHRYTDRPICLEQGGPAVPLTAD